MPLFLNVSRSKVIKEIKEKPTLRCFLRIV